MSNDINRESMIQTVVDTLEEAAFIFTELADEPPPGWPPADTIMEARLGFEGDKNGMMMIAATNEPIAELAANLLGTSPEDTDAISKQSDAFGEILNIIGGALLDAWFGNEADVRLQIPKVQKLKVGEYEKELDRSSVRASLVTEDGHRIDAAVFV